MDGSGLRQPAAQAPACSQRECLVTWLARLARPPCRDGRVTGKQIRNSSAVCNRGLVFQTDAWRRLDLQVCVLKQARSSSSSSSSSSVGGSAPAPRPGAAACGARRAGGARCSMPALTHTPIHVCMQVHRQSDREFIPRCTPSALAPHQRQSWTACGAPAGAPHRGACWPFVRSQHLRPAPPQPPLRFSNCPRSRLLHERPSWQEDGIVPTRLYCKNRNVERENAEELGRLPGPAHEYRAGAGRRRGRAPLGPRPLSHLHLPAHQALAGPVRPRG